MQKDAGLDLKRNLIYPKHGVPAVKIAFDLCGWPF